MDPNYNPDHDTDDADPERDRQSAEDEWGRLDVETAQRAALGHYGTWLEFYDRDALVGQDEFTRMSIQDRVARINACHDRPILDNNGDDIGG